MSESVIGFNQSERKIMQDVCVFESYSEVDVLTDNLANSEEYYSSGSSSAWHDRKTTHAIFRISCDVDIDIYIESSIDGSQNDTTNLPPIAYKAGTPQPPHIFVLAACSFWRLRLVNVGGADSTSLRFGVYECSNPGQLNSPISSTVAQNADSTVVRMMPPWLEFADGKFSGTSTVNKMGFNGDVDTGTTPEDLIVAGGTYAGFPARGAEEFAVVSTSASDTGTLTFSYLADANATEYTSVSVTLNGTTEVETGISGDRAHTMRYDSGAATTYNVGTISLYHLNTPANVFLTIAVGRSQSNYAVYTVPADTDAVINRIHSAIRKSTSASVSVALWVRGSAGTGPRLRRPNTASQGSSLIEKFDSGLNLSPGTDIKLEVTETSANSVEVVGGMDIYLRLRQ